MELLHSSSIFLRGYFSFSLGICLPEFRPFIFFVSLNSVAGPLFSQYARSRWEKSHFLSWFQLPSVLMSPTYLHFLLSCFVLSVLIIIFVFISPIFSNLICIVLYCIFSRIFFSFLTYSLCFDMLAIGIKFLTCLLVVMVL